MYEHNEQTHQLLRGIEHDRESILQQSEAQYKWRELKKLSGWLNSHTLPMESQKSKASRRQLEVHSVVTKALDHFWTRWQAETEIHSLNFAQINL